jgi:hypothetical protein
LRTLLLLAFFVPALLPCVSGLPVSVAQAAELTERGYGPVSSPQAATIDVAVTSIAISPYGQPYVHEGNPVTLAIGVTNKGTGEATFTVSLRDDTANELIGSQEVTLDAGASTTINITWDTTGTTGGPAPPAPPAPGTIHALTATASLDGDTVKSNDSMSFQPGIWVIAAPTPLGINFPDDYKTPMAQITGDLASDEPGEHTEIEPLSETYIVPLSVQKDAAFSGPSIATAPTSLTAIFSSETEFEQATEFAKPAITTIAATIPKIGVDGIRAKREQTVSTPAIATSASPLNAIFLHQEKPGTALTVADPTLTTQADVLAQVFASPIETKAVVRLTKPSADTDTTAPDPIVAYPTQSELLDSLAEPTIATRGSQLPTVFNTWTNAGTEGSLAISGFQTEAMALDGVFRTTVPASQLYPGTKPDLTTLIATTGTIRGQIILQGRASSLGSYVEIDGHITFADRQGYFLIQQPAGAFDLTATAPGYLSHITYNISLEPGDELELPAVTLPFGDADGNGVIDIYDLAVAAGNYGRTISGIWFR